jgi:hypothetical protein
VSDGDALLELLGRVRRRSRALAAVEGAVAGAAVGLAGAALILLAARWGWVRVLPGARVVVLAAAGGGLGALVFALRRVSLGACARSLDAAAGRRGGDRQNADRVLAALALVQPASTEPGAFAAAAIRDALRSTGSIAVAEAAPWRRPRGLPALLATSGLAAALALWPLSRAPASMRTASAPSASSRRAPMNPALLAAEREAAEKAVRRAQALEDPEMARLAAELRTVLDALTAGEMSPGEALERLAALERRAAEAAAQAEALKQALGAAGETLSSQAQTRALGAAMQNLDGAAGAKALADLASRAAEMAQAERERVARSLEQAADRAAAAGAEAQRQQSAAQEQQRRLARESGANRASDPGRPGGPQDRQLKQLERDLSDSAERCRQDPESCRGALDEAAADMPDMARQAQRSGARQGLDQTIGQAREALRRLEPGERGQRMAEQRFERAAGGQPGAPSGSAGGQEAEGADGTEAGRTGAGSGGQPRPGGEQGEGPAGAQGGAQAGRAGAAEAVAGGGVGNQSGGDPLGGRGAPTGGGTPHEAKLRNGTGPTRAEVIETGAHKGFAHTEYQRVFDDYRAAVEETLDTTAVPAGRRYLVRRYFQLIRPREGGHGDKP